MSLPPTTEKCTWLARFSPPVARLVEPVGNRCSAVRGLGSCGEDFQQRCPVPTPAECGSPVPSSAQSSHAFPNSSAKWWTRIVTSAGEELALMDSWKP